MLLILDFDGVLFNDERFKRDYRSLFRRHGIPHHVHQGAYAESKTRHRGGYRHELHLALIHERVPSLGIPEIESDIRILLARSRDYLFADAEPFLRHWQARTMRLALVSSGRIFQKRKVAASGIVHLFRPVVVADTSDKVAPVRDIIKKAPAGAVFFIDDKKSVVDAVKKNFPHISVIQLVRRKWQEHSARADAIVPNLAAARRFIEWSYS